MSSNIRDSMSYSGNPPPPPSRSQRCPISSKMQHGMSYNNDPPRPEAITGSQRTRTLSAQGSSHSNTNN
ncbi:hypothetical protein P8452_13094 [Trifolium repens]|nr:hypothetical protein P8452_13094 [Trifolium repens]